MQKKKKKPPRVLYGPFSGRLLLLFLQNLGEIDWIMRIQRDSVRIYEYSTWI